MNYTRLALIFLVLLLAPIPALATGFNTVGDGLVVSFDGSLTAENGIAGAVQFLIDGVYDPDTGDPLDGGFAYFYYLNSTTAKPVYTTSAMGTEADNPVVLSSMGVATVYGLGNYKIVVTDADGVIKYTYADLYFFNQSLGGDGGGGGSTISGGVLDVQDPMTVTLVTRVKTDQVASSLSYVYAVDASTGTEYPIKFGSATAGYGIYCDVTNHRFGVNDDTPSYTVDVNGTFRATGAVSAASVAATGAVSAASVAATGAVSGGTLASAGNAQIYGSIYEGTPLVALSAKYLGITAKAQNSEKLDGIDSTGFIQASLGGTQYVSGILDIGNIQTDSLEISAVNPDFQLTDIFATHRRLNLTIDATGHSRIRTDGQYFSITDYDSTATFVPFNVDVVNNFVGVNKATPTVALDVVGAIAATGNITGATVSGTTVAATNGAKSITLTHNGSTTGTIQTSEKANAITITAAGVDVSATNFTAANVDCYTVVATGTVSAAVGNFTTAILGASVLTDAELTGNGHALNAFYVKRNTDAVYLETDTLRETKVYGVDISSSDLLNFRAGHFFTNHGLYRDKATGYWGLEDDTPSYLLDVNGTFRAATSVASPIGNITTVNATTVNGASGVFSGVVSADDFNAAQSVECDLLYADNYIRCGGSLPALYIYTTGGSTSQTGTIYFGGDHAGGYPYYIRWDYNSVTPKNLLTFNNSSANPNMVFSPYGGVSIAPLGAHDMCGDAYALYVGGSRSPYPGKGVAVEISDQVSGGIRIMPYVASGCGAVYGADQQENLDDLRIGMRTANNGLYWDTDEARLGVQDDTPSHTVDVNGEVGTNTLVLRNPPNATATMLGWNPASSEVCLLVSSKRFKTDIVDLDFSWSDYNALKPVTYRMKNEPNGPALEGLIAEEVNKVYPGTVILDKEGLPLSIDYGRLISPTIAAVQDLKRENEELKARLEVLEKALGVR